MQPEGCLLAHIHADVLHFAVVEKVLAALVNEELRVLQQVSLMSDEPIGAGAGGFFVGYGQKNHIAIKGYFLPLQHHHYYQLGQAFVFHVLCAASPNPAVVNFATEGRNFPMRGIAGDHIHVVQQDDRLLRLSICSGMRQASPEIAASGSVFERAVLDAFLIKNLFVKRNGVHLMAGRVRGVDAQILLHPGHREIGILMQMVSGNAGRSHCERRLLRACDCRRPGEKTRD